MMTLSVRGPTLDAESDAYARQFLTKVDPRIERI